MKDRDGFKDKDSYKDRYSSYKDRDSLIFKLLYFLMALGAVLLIVGALILKWPGGSEDGGTPNTEISSEESTEPESASKGFEINSETEDEQSQETEDQKDALDITEEPPVETSEDTYIDIDEEPPFKTELRMTVLDVGQGLSILLESNGQIMLYDGGESDASSYVVAYLKKRGITKLDYMVASHYDSDHINGLIGALNVLEVKKVLGPDYEDDSDIYESFAEACSKKGLEIEHPSVGDVIELGSAEITVMAPGEVSEIPNNNSIVLRVVNGYDTFLLMGDAEYGEEDWMFGTDADLRAEVIVVAHHGSRSSTSRDFIRAVMPEYAIISCGEGNPYGHPEAGVLVILKNAGVQLYRTDKQGEIIAYSDGEEISWNHEPCNDFTPGVKK